MYVTMGCIYEQNPPQADKNVNSSFMLKPHPLMMKFHVKFGEGWKHNFDDITECEG